MIVHKTSRMLMNQEPPVGSSGGGVPPAGPQNAPTPTPPQADPNAAPAVGAQPQPAPQPGRREQVHSLKDSDFKRVKDDARAKGEKTGAENLLKELGFGTKEEAQKFFVKAKEAMKRPPPGKQQPGQDQPPGTPGTGQEARKVRDLTQAVEAEKKGRIQAQRRVRELEGKLAATEAQHELRESVILRGASDPDVVVHLVQREAAKAAGGKTGDELEAALSAFDEEKFLDKLKKDRPYLFTGPEIRPMTTGPGAGNAPPPPAPEVVQQQNNLPIDAMKMKPEEFREYVRKLGANGSKAHV